MAANEVPEGLAEGDLVVLERRLTTDDFLSACWTMDLDKRQQALDEIEKQIKELVTKEKTSGGNNLALSTQSEQLVYHLEGILRHAYCCPFKDMRDRCQALLQWTADQNHPIPKLLNNSPSSFIAAKHCVHFNDPEKEDLQALLEESFAVKGRASNIFMLMCLFPSFAEKYEAVYRFIIEGQGPLPMFWRNYLAIMGASRHNCRYFIVQQEVQFYANGGDLNWLRGLSFAPVKLQKLATLNALLAHQPWLINQSHLDALISGNDNDNWSVSELLQAVMILVLFHSLSGIAFGLGVVPEADREGGVQGRANESPLFSPTSPAEHAHEPTTPSKDLTNELLEKLNQIKMSKLEEEPKGQGRELSVEEVQQRQKQFEDSEKISSTPAQNKLAKKVVIYSKYWGNVEMKHADFKVGVADYRTLRLQDYNWEDHGFSLINRYYPGVAELLDSLFTETRTMTEYHLFNSQDVDTGPFREAIWYYILRLKGMMHDDYDYSQVNILLDIPIKSYMKNIACMPEVITQSEYANMGVKLLDKEKVHINLLVMEARHQAEILYVLNALMKLKGE